MAKTNKDLLLEALSRCSDKEFVDYLDGRDRCKRCSNHYFDPGYGFCHKYTNHSTCDDGQLEWLESYPDEVLQNKYDKKYHNCKNYLAAKAMDDLLKLLYDLQIIPFHDSYNPYEVYKFIDRLRLKEINDRYHKDVLIYPQDSSDMMQILQDLITMQYYIEKYLITKIEEKDYVRIAKELLAAAYLKEEDD